MPFVAIPDTIRVALTYLPAGVNVLHIRPNAGSGPYSASEVEDAVDALVTEWVAQIMPLLSNQVVLDICTGTDISVAGGATFQLTAAEPGGVAGEDLPNNVAACISWKSAFADRRKRGRTFITGIPRAAQDNQANLMTSTFATDLGQAAEDLITNLNAAGYQLLVASRLNGTSTGIEFSTVNRRLDTQRRRLGY